MTIKQLQAVYRQYNKKWFDSRLPADVAMSFEDMSASDKAGLCTTYHETGSPPIHTLHFDKAFQAYDQLLKFFLIHEMAHVAAYPNEKAAHDQAFQDEMIKLAFRGALRELW